MVQDGSRQTKIIATAAGTLDLIPASADQLRGIAHYWPLEVVTTTDDPDRYALVFQSGEREVQGVKLQSADAPEPGAVLVHDRNRALIAAALPYYLSSGHLGVMMPCAYYKVKPGGMAETGFALFVGPDAASRPEAADGVRTVYDDRLGVGATAMILDMVTAIAAASRELRLPVMTFVGMELRSRLDMEGLTMSFLIQGAVAFAVRDPIEEADPLWEQVVRSGFTRLLYSPLRLAALSSAPPTETPQI